MELYISLFALACALYQLHLQRVHNGKSLAPLVQIDVIDRKPVIAVRIQNNGVGPFVITKITFTKDEKHYSSIEHCLTLDPSSYQQNTISNTVNKVILTGAYHEVFWTEFDDTDTKEDIENVKQQLSAITLKVEGRDIYNNKIATTRELDWFIRYQNANSKNNGNKQQLAGAH